VIIGAFLNGLGILLGALLGLALRRPLTASAQEFCKAALGGLTVLFGLRLAAHSAILSAMFAEWLSGAAGLGSLTLDAYSRQDFSLMWATVLVSTLATYLFFTLTIAAEGMVLDRSR